LHRLLNRRPSSAVMAAAMAPVAAVLIFAGATATTALAAPYRNVDLLKTFSRQLPKVKKTTTVPILLPATLPLGGTYKLYASSRATRTSYELSLEAAPNCMGANARFVATFDAKRGGRLPLKTNVRLAAGDPAVYHPSTCGGSCAPASFWFTHRGVLYSWQAKDLPKGGKAILIKMANDAIAAGPR
jgi:hypothetical protein